MTTPIITEAIVDIARSFAGLIRDIDPAFVKAYLRLRCNETSAEAKASYVGSDGAVKIVDVLQHKAFFHAAAPSGRQLLSRLEKIKGVVVLVLASDMTYELKFDYVDVDRWAITKLNGGSGIPEGLEIDDA